VLWPSHLLIRHAGARFIGDVSFSLADFHSVLPAPNRGRAEALELAQALARQAQAAPESFADLVRTHSEDVVRRDGGGALGGVTAAQLKAWPEVLDALFALEPGQVSEVVESGYGFHIFLRRPPPEQQVVTGRRIVIGHAQARWLGTLDAGTPPVRSRDDAFELAQRIYAEAQANPESFLDLIGRYSELRDRVRGGDFGTWTNVEPCPFPREIEQLGQLQIGEVARPFDSLFGVQIVQRVPNRERQEYAMEGIRFDFDPRLPADHPRSSSSMLASARALNARWRSAPSLPPPLEPGQFSFTSQWTDGRGSPEVLAALAEVPLGQLIHEPVRSASRYFVGRRVAPAPKLPVEPLFDLPSPVSGG
jgi:hypothetical protein